MEQKREPRNKPVYILSIKFRQKHQNMQWGRIISSIKEVGKTGQAHAKEWIQTPVLHHTEKSAQNGLKT